MLFSKLIHPQILSVLAAAGHHSTILIADGNYPALNKRGPQAQLVSLNLMPGIPTCNQVLEAILSAVPVEAVQTMQTETEGPYALGGDPPVWDDYRITMKNAGLAIDLQPTEKWAFYEAVSTPDHVLTIQTADQQRYANILLTLGVRSPVARLDRAREESSGAWFGLGGLRHASSDTFLVTALVNQITETSRRANRPAVTVSRDDPSPSRPIENPVGWDLTPIKTAPVGLSAAAVQAATQTDTKR